MNSEAGELLESPLCSNCWNGVKLVVLALVVPNKIIADLQQQMDMVDQDLQQIEFQAKRLLSEQAKIDAQGLIQLRQQIEEEKQQRVAFKAQVAERLKEAEKLEIGSEIAQGQMEQTITVKIGDNLDALMGSEILLEDGKVVAFRQ